MNSMIILAALVGILIGALATAFIMQRRNTRLVAQVETFRVQAETEKRRSEETKADMEKREESLRQHTQQLLSEAKAEADQRHRDALAQQQAHFDETIQRVTAQMRLATDDMLRQRQQEFTQSSGDTLGQIVNPLRETIDQMKRAMDDTTLRQTNLTGEMKAGIENMLRQSQAAQRSADELARTFRLGSRVQGDWGETILDELLQSQGLQRGIHYDTQPYIRDAHGNIIKNIQGQTMRPDIILHLDQRREVIIDSKVSLSAFMDYANAQTDEERRRHLHLHIESLKAHVRSLAAKDYASYIQPPKVRMDYVIMFVPHSAALWTALGAQPDLWRNAMAQNVFIADEQTLFAALRIVSLTWTQIAQAQNHEKVYTLANEMLDRVGQFLKKYQDIDRALTAARAAYDAGARKLAPTGQSILTTCAKLQKLGARQSDKNPLPPLTDIDDILAIDVATATSSVDNNSQYVSNNATNDVSNDISFSANEETRQTPSEETSDTADGNTSINITT